MDPTLAVNVALLRPAPILTLAGTVMLALLLESATLTALAAAAVSVAVQVDVPGAFTVAGEQLKLPSCARVTRLMVACWLWPFKVAVTMALWLLLTLPDVAVKVAVVWPERTVTFAGTVSSPLLLLSETTAALGATLFKVTVQVIEALLPSDEGAQASELGCGGATRFNVAVLVTAPAVAVTIAV